MGCTIYLRIVSHSPHKFVRNLNICQSTEEKEMTCFIIIIDDGSAARLPLAPAAKSKAASPQALPTHSVKIGTFTYLQCGH
jgi:hypothetical protein